MADLVKIKGLKGKQNKKKWAKNIDVSGLLEARARDHDQMLRSQFRQNLIVTDDKDSGRMPLDPNRFKQQLEITSVKKIYDNKIRRDVSLKDIVDPWGDNTAQSITKKSTPLQIPSVIIPETGHSYNPREEDIQKLKDRVIDYEKPTYTEKVKKNISTQLPEVVVRYRNKKKRAAYLQQKKRKQQKQFKQQLHSIKKIKKEIQERHEQIQKGIEQRKHKKQLQQQLDRTGRVKKGKKIGKKPYKFRQYIPEAQSKVDKLSHISLSNELVRERFDTIFRRGIFEPRTIKVHSNKKKHIKVKERGFIEE